MSSDPDDPITELLGFLRLFAGPVTEALSELDLSRVTAFTSQAHQLLGSVARLERSVSDLEGAINRLSTQLEDLLRRLDAE